MRRSNCKLFELRCLTEKRRIIIFGLSQHLYTFMNRDRDMICLDNIEYIVDNNSELHGTRTELCGKVLPIKSAEELKCEQNAMILIASAIPQNVLAIYEQLERMNLDDSLSCYSLCVIEDTQEFDNSAMSVAGTNGIRHIEKIIHSFWFSGEEKPKAYQRCIDSWKRFCPDYQIIEWNSNNYDVTKNQYMLSAYNRKRWAFVSDYARLDVVYNFGGIYMDMDVELLRPMDDLLGNKAFFSFDYTRHVDLGSGFGATKAHPLVKKLLTQYENILFEEDMENGRYATPQPTRLLPIFEAFGYRRNNSVQIIKDCLFLSPDYVKIIEGHATGLETFSGLEYAIHWHNAGWWDEKKREQRNETQRKLTELKRIFCC